MRDFPVGQVFKCTLVHSLLYKFIVFPAQAYNFCFMYSNFLRTKNYIHFYTSASGIFLYYS